MRIDIDEVLKMQKRRAEINYTRLADAEFYKDGKPFKVDKKVLDDFAFTGLSNVDFITTEFYIDGFNDPT